MENSDSGDKLFDDVGYDDNDNYNENNSDQHQSSDVERDMETYK